jgi:hypothetical protein
MPGYEASKGRTFFFILIVFIGLVCLLELGGRIALSVQYKTAQYLVYGFLQRPRFQQVQGRPPFVNYYKGVPSRSAKNPVNSLGLRGPEIGSKKPGTVRIMCLGASTTYGDNLSYQDTYPVHLQKKLVQSIGFGGYEVINAGQPGFDLNHIISFVEYEGNVLQPDIVLVLSANNNFKAPGFWFVDVQQQAQRRDRASQSAPVGLHRLARLRAVVVRYSAVGRIWENFLIRGWLKYSAEFPWEAFAKALMADDNIWEAEYRRNLHRLIGSILVSNPDARIILLEQAVNTIQFPVLVGPWRKSWQIMREVASRYSNVDVLDVYTPVITAAAAGEPVWQDKDRRDPLHLSAVGNAIVAETILGALKTLGVHKGAE